MPIDAGTIWASIRIRLDKLNADVGQAVKKMDSMAKAINESGKAVENLNKLGSKMSLMVTAPLVAAGAAAVKFASDETEALNAANVVFKTSAKTITEWGDNAAKQAGLSRAEFYQSAAVTGAMLKGMNYTLDESADATIELTKRAADMASIFNTDVKDSTTAVAAAIRGEMEPIRRYGVTLNDAGVKAKALAMGLYDGKGELDSYAKAQARVALILEQTRDIAGDFVNTSDQQANSTRILIAETKNQAAALGKELLPYALQLIQGLRKIVDGFGAMTDEQKQTIIKVAALAAGLGPLTVGIGKAIQAVNLMKVALVALSANPIGLAILGVAALGMGLSKLGDMNNQRMLEEVGEQFGAMAEEANLTAQKISDIQEALATSGKGGFTFETVAEQVAQMKDDFGVTYDQLLRIGTQSGKVSEEYKRTLSNVIALKEQEQARYDAVYGSAQFAAKFRGETEKTAEAMGDIKAPEITDQIRARLLAEKEYNAALKTANDLRKLGAIDDAELRELQIKAAEDYRDALVEVGYASESELGTKGQAALIQTIETLKALGAESTVFDVLVDKVNALDVETAKTSSAMRNDLLAELEKARATIGEDLFSQLTGKVNLFYDKLEEKEAMERFRENMQYAIQTASDLFSALSSLISAVYDNKIAKIDEALQAELEANGLAEESAVETAERELAEAIETGDAENVAEAEDKLKKAQIEDKYAKKKADIEYEGAMMVWNLQRLQTIAGGVLAVMNAFASGIKFGPYVAAAYAAAAGVVSAIQLGAVEQTKPIKSYQTGGIVSSTNGGQVGRLAENGYNEYLFNEGESGDPWSRKMAGFIASALADKLMTNITLVNEVDGDVLMKVLLPRLNSGQYRVKWSE